MASKGIRNTALAFGDFEISVTMSKAQTSRDIKTELVFETTGQKVPAGRGGGGGGMAGTVRAVEGTNGTVRLPKNELDAIVEESKQRYETMQVLETIDYRQVDTARIIGSYWLQPRAGTAKGLGLLAHGLKNTGRVAVVKWVSTSREKLGVIRVRHTRDGKLALLLSELAFANDFAGPDEDALAINDVELSPAAVKVAERMVKAFARDGEAMVDTASDTAVDARLALVEMISTRAMDEALQASASDALDGELTIRRA